MKTTSLTIHIILGSRHGLRDRQNFFVTINGARHIKQFRKILRTQTREKAIIFALSKGRTVDPQKKNDPVRLTLTREGAFWDLMR